jgi:hypothetical protein
MFFLNVVWERVGLCFCEGDLGKGMFFKKVVWEKVCFCKVSLEKSMFFTPFGPGKGIIFGPATEGVSGPGPSLCCLPIPF